MPVFNPHRVERAGKRATTALRRTQHPHLEGLATRTLGVAADPRRLPGELELARRAGEALLADAVRQERSAREAQAAAVEVLRHLGGYGTSWRNVGELLGMSGPAAHKRYAALVEAPEAQVTIDEAIADTAAAPA